MNALRRSLALLFVLLAATALTATPVTAAESTDQYSLAGVGVIPQQATPNASTNASITFENQTRTGSSVYVTSVTLSDGGFVVLKEPGPNGTIVGVSLRLAPGTHQGKVTLRGVPGARLNQSRLGENTTLVATLYRDSDGDDRFDGLLASGTDEPYIENATPVRDRAHITIPGDERATTANVTITNQTTNGTTISVASVTLPDGGYVGVHRGGYNGSNTTESMVGATDYLEPGTYENVTATLDANGSNDSTQLDSGRISAVVYEDTDGDHQFQYVPSAGVEDGPYLENGTPVAASAFVTVERPETPTPTQTPTQTSTPTAEASAPTPATTAESRTTEPQTAGQQKSQAVARDHDELTPYGGENDARMGILDNPLFPLLVLAFAVFAVLAAVGGR